MSFDRTYLHTTLVAFDQWWAAMIFNRPDLTISTMCYLVHAGGAAPLKLWRWQRWLLTGIAALLYGFWPAHCARAAQADRARAASTQEILK